MGRDWKGGSGAECVAVYELSTDATLNAKAAL